MLGKQHVTHDIREIKVHENHLTDQHIIADTFNKYFSSIIDITKFNGSANIGFPNSSTYSYLDQRVRVFSQPMTFKSCSTKEIIPIVKSLKTKNSFGYDEISTKILKITATFIRSPLTYICNKSTSTGIFPEGLKYSIIKRLYKKGDRTDLPNYRPMSILTSFSKVLEKVLYKQLMEYLNNNNILFTHQFGFRKRFATEDAIFKLTHDILEALNRKTPVGSIFF